MNEMMRLASSTSTSHAQTLTGLLLAIFLSTGQPLVSQAQELGGQGDQILLPITGGGVSAAQMFDLLAEDLHPIASGVAAFTRGVAGRDFVRLPASSVDQLVTKYPQIFAYAESNGQVTHLAVNKEALATEMADSKSSLRSYLSGVTKLPMASFKKVDSTWAQVRGVPERVVVTMAGLQSAEDSAEEIATTVHKRTNLPTCVFAYPNDGPIGASGEMLATKLAEFHREYPATKITLITHSMGGLVSRAALELSVDDPKNNSFGVDQLIQVCPPNHGSALAEYGSLLEAGEQIYRLMNTPRNRERGKVLRAIVDGFGEASIDLAPDSRFLQELNAAERNPNVQYSIIAGDAGPFRGRFAPLLGSLWERLSESVAEPQELDRRIRDLLQCEEFIQGKGDGVVTIESAQLQSVDDFELLQINHLVWYHLDKDDGQVMLDAIWARLGTSL